MAILLSSRAESLKFNIGAVLIGSYINAVLYGIALICVYIYATGERSTRDSLFVKVAVAACAILDTVTTFAVCGNVFYLTVSRWDHYNREFRSHWTAVIWFICTAWSEVIVQSFMVRRFFIVSRHYFISILIILLMILSLERNMYLGITSAIGHLPVDKRPENLRPVLLALCASTAADLVTMLAMFWKLKVTNTYSRITHNLVRRISAMVIITGTLTCMVALAIMISFITYPVSSLSTCFGFFIGRVYSLTMLFTLLYRDMIKDDQWIQLDEAGREILSASEGPMSHSSDPANLPPVSTGTQVSDMIFESRSNLSRRGSHQDHVAVEHAENSNLQSTIKIASPEEYA